MLNQSCPTCGSESPQGAAFCASCGDALPPSQRWTQPQLPLSRLGIASIVVSVVLTTPLVYLSLARLVEATDYGRIAVDDGGALAGSFVFPGMMVSGRLGPFLFRRVRRAGKDDRFDEIKRSFSRLLLTWTLQGLWVSLTLATALAAVTSTEPKGLDLFVFIGLAVWALGFTLEATADLQKSRFRGDPANKGSFITSGLWAISRHPNYFGEITLWTGIAIVAFPVLRGWQFVTLISPVFVYLLITRVSGVPLLEKKADTTWGGQEAYQVYKRRTPVLVPFLGRRQR